MEDFQYIIISLIKIMDAIWLKEPSTLVAMMKLINQLNYYLAP